MEKNKKIADLKGVISKEKRYSTLAKKEGDYAKESQKKERAKGLKEMAKDSGHEARIAYIFAKKRQGIVKKEKDKLSKLVKKP